MDFDIYNANRTHYKLLHVTTALFIVKILNTRYQFLPLFIVVQVFQLIQQVLQSQIRVRILRLEGQIFNDLPDLLGRQLRLLFLRRLEEKLVTQVNEETTGGSPREFLLVLFEDCEKTRLYVHLNVSVEMSVRFDLLVVDASLGVWTVGIFGALSWVARNQGVAHVSGVAGANGTLLVRPVVAGLAARVRPARIWLAEVS
jgi:hypothetical protein